MLESLVASGEHQLKKVKGIFGYFSPSGKLLYDKHMLHLIIGRASWMEEEKGSVPVVSCLLISAVTSLY